MSPQEERHHSSLSSWFRHQKSRFRSRKEITTLNAAQQASGGSSQRLSQASEEAAQTSSNINPRTTATINNPSLVSEVSPAAQPHDSGAPATDSAANDLLRERITETPGNVLIHSASHGKANSAEDTLWTEAIRLLQTAQPEQYARLMLLSKQNGIAEPGLESLMENERKKQHHISLAAEDTIRNILNFKDLAISIAALDPSKVTSIVLRGFSYIGQALIDNEALFRDHELDIRRLTSRLRHWMDIECWYLQSNASGDNETDRLRTMKECLLALYSTKLEVIILLCEAYDQSRPARLVLPRTATWRDAIKRWDESDKACQCEFDGLRGKLDQCLSIRKWITDHDAEKDHDDVKVNIKQKEYPSSGQWLLDRDQYKTWLSGGSLEAHDKYRNVIWIRGTVGTGKTSLIARVIEQHRLTSYAYRDYRLAYFYCTDQEGSARKSYQHVLQSLLRQVAYDPVRGTMMPAIRRAYSQGENSFLFSNCEDLLVATMDEGIKLRIVIDALDECDDPERLLKALHNIVESAPGQCQLLVSGRPEVQVQRRFANSIVVDIQEGTTFIDMRNYITKEVKRADKSERIFGGEREDLEDRLINIMNRKANGMFEWVRLQLGLFTAYNETGSADMELDLEELENDATLVGLDELNKTYKRIFEKNTRDKRTSREAAKLIYQCLIVLDVPWITHVVHALNMPSSSSKQPFTARDIAKYGCNFITTATLSDMPDDPYVKFSHISAKQYLQNEQEGYDSTACHIAMAKLCIRFWNERAVPGTGNMEDFDKRRFFGRTLEISLRKLSRSERQQSGISQLLIDYSVHEDSVFAPEPWLVNFHSIFNACLSSDDGRWTEWIKMQSVLEFAAHYGLIEVVEAIFASLEEYLLEETVNRVLFFAKYKGRTEITDCVMHRLQINNPDLEFDLSTLNPKVSKGKFRVIWRPSEVHKGRDYPVLIEV